MKQPKLVGEHRPSNTEWILQSALPGFFVHCLKTDKTLSPVGKHFPFPTALQTRLFPSIQMRRPLQGKWATWSNPHRTARWQRKDHGDRVSWRFTIWPIWEEPNPVLGAQQFSNLSPPDTLLTGGIRSHQIHENKVKWWLPEVSGRELSNGYGISDLHDGKTSGDLLHNKVNIFYPTEM